MKRDSSESQSGENNLVAQWELVLNLESERGCGWTAMERGEPSGWEGEIETL